MYKQEPQLVHSYASGIDSVLSFLLAETVKNGSTKSVCTANPQKCRSCELHTDACGVLLETPLPFCTCTVRPSRFRSHTRLHGAQLCLPRRNDQQQPEAPAHLAGEV